MTTSFFMPRVSGNRPILPGSSPVMQAAVPSNSPAAAPEVTIPASAPVSSAITLLAPACSSAISTQKAPASVMAAATSVWRKPPDNRVEGPLALIIVRTPKRS